MRNYCIGFYLIILFGMSQIGCGSQKKMTSQSVDLPTFYEDRYQYPDPYWPTSTNVEALGWSPGKLQLAQNYFDEQESAALMVVHKGVVVASWGEVTDRYLVQSVRKGLLNSLFGVYVDAGKISLSSTLADLGIDDSDPPLTSQQRSATIEHLLRSRSGINHQALYEVGSWKRLRMELPALEPGTSWIYNNWDFNALGTIFEKISSMTIHEAFSKHIAIPLQLEDFRVQDIEYTTRLSWSEKVMKNSSDHPAYLFNMSTRDLARIGLLYLSKGQWKDQQIFSTDWAEATFDGIDTEIQGLGYYGYLWMTDAGDRRRFPNAGFTDRIHFVSGNRGHYILIAPYLDLVIVHQVATKGAGISSQIKRRLFGSPSISDSSFEELLRLITAAHPAMGN